VFKQTAGLRGDYKDELHNLTLLYHLEHPNILELFGSYTYRGKHNLLFPLAGRGNLAKLLREPAFFVSFGSGILYCPQQIVLSD